MTISCFCTAKLLRFGAGSSELLGEDLVFNKIKKPMIVTDQGVAAAGILKKITDVLDRSKISYVVFDEVKANPTDVIADKGRDVYDQNQCDGLVAVGGGSPIDCAKTIGVIVGTKDSIRDHLQFEPLPNYPFLAAITTTAGTGTETTHWCVVGDTRGEFPRKTVIGDFPMMPAVSYLDPALMVGLPPAVTASTGMDAMTHAIEGYLTLAVDAFSEVMAKAGIEKLAKYLPRAVGNGADMEAREQVAYGQSMAAMGFDSVGLGLTHAMAHPLSDRYNMAHGDANAVLLPYVLRYNRIVRMDRLADVARLMGLNTDGMSALEAATAACDYIVVLNSLIGVPAKISELAQARGLEVDRKDIPSLAAAAMVDNNARFNPRIPTLAEVTALYEEAW